MALSSQTRLCVVRPLRKVQRTRRILGIEGKLSIAVREQSGSLRLALARASHRMNPAHFVAFYVVLPLFVGLLVLWLLG